jgi:hypothetical protein
MERIGEILVEMKACTREELRAGLETQAILGGRIGTNLLELGIIDEGQLAAALTRAYGLPCISGDVEPDPAAIEAVTANLAARFGVVPLELDGKRLRVAVSDPRNFSKLDELAFATGKTVVPVLAAESRVWSLLRRFYGVDVHLRGLAVDDELESAAAERGSVALPRPGEPGGAPRVLTLAEALARIGQVSDPVVLSTLLVRGAAGIVGRSVFFKCHERYASGWLGAGRLFAHEVRGLNVPLDRESWFGPAAELRAPVIGPLRASTGTARFFDALGTPLPFNAFLAPVLLRGRAVALLYADAGPGGTVRDEAADLIALTSTLNRRLELLAPVSSGR